MKRLLIQKMNDYRNHRIINAAIHPCGDNRRMVSKMLMVFSHMNKTSLLICSNINENTMYHFVDGH